MHGIKPSSFLLASAVILAGLSSWSEAAVNLGTGNDSLLGGDLTDPKDAIVEKPGVNYGQSLSEDEMRPLNTGWIGLKMAPVSPPGSPPHQAHPYQSWQGAPACSLFLNKPETRKWYVGFKDGGKGGPTEKEPYFLAVQLREPTILTHFTLTTAPDMPDRDPKSWAIQGSATGKGDDWTNIYKCTAPDRMTSPLNANPRNETTLFTSFTSATMDREVDQANLAKLQTRLKDTKLEKADFVLPGKAYPWFRIVIYSCFNPNSTTFRDFNRPPGFSLGQLELFGVKGAPAAHKSPTGQASGFRQPDPKARPDLFVWTDTCNVYVLRDGDAALLIDLGDGSVLDHLDEIGVKRVEQILFTDHHREQCQGIGRIDRALTKVAAPKAEQAFFEDPTGFRKWFPKLEDPFSVYGASYLRPPRESIALDRALEPGESFRWHERELVCVDTPGHSPGGLSYLLRRGEQSIAFTGGLMHDGSKMTNWYDSEWDYGFAKGLDTLVGSVERLLEEPLALALPSQGPPIRKPLVQLETYRVKLAEFRKSYLRGYPVFTSSEQDRDAFSKPTALPLINQVTPHLFKLSHKTQGKNFAIIVSDRGKGLVLDCGLIAEAELDEIVAGMKTHFGLQDIEALWISHSHGDHFLLGPVLKRKYGAKTWTLDRIVDRCENPRRYDYSALIGTYSDGFDGMKIDRAFRDGESFEWEGYQFRMDWMPGQTEFGCCLWLELDGKRIAFTGDNLFGNPADPSQDGHEAVVARNSTIFEEGYLYAARYLQKLKPDLVMGSHSFVMNNPAALIDRYHDWGKRIIALYQGLLPDRDYEYHYDPYWISAYPYRVDFSEHEVQGVTITVRNFRNSLQRHRVELKLPPGITAIPAVLEGTVSPESRKSFKVKLTADREAVSRGVQIVPLDITLDGKRYGELFDFLIRARE